MEAVIIAAGRGSRLHNIYSPKPLAQIFGLRLIERIILAAKRAGIKDFKIVVGYKSKKIKQDLGDGEKFGVRIQYIENPEWEKGNGVSVLKAKNFVSDKFILLMSDHIFDETILQKLLMAEVKPGHCILCVDKNLSGEHFDLDDVTKVYIKKNKVQKIDKSIGRFNAIDTGIFLCTPAIFDALEKSIENGQYSLSAGNQILARYKKLETLDVTGSFWVDVDNEQALKKAKKILTQQLFKPTDGPISKSFNRRISTRISAFLAQYNISPNSITLFSFVLAVLSSIFIALGGYVNLVIGGITAQLSSILDGCDGEIARLKFKFSTFGEWLDRVLDRYADSLIILGITHNLWKSYMHEMVWFIGFLALTGAYMNSYTARIHDELLYSNSNGKSILRIGRDVRIFIIFVGAILNQLLLSTIILILMTNIESLRRLWVLRNAYKEVTTVH